MKCGMHVCVPSPGLLSGSSLLTELLTSVSLTILIQHLEINNINIDI